MKRSIFTTIVMFSIISPSTAQPEQICAPESIPATAPSERFQIAEATLTDTDTGLMWRRCFEGKSGADCSQGELRLMSWPAALQHAEQVNDDRRYQGYGDWRLANIKELITIAELQCVQPALNLELFPSAPAQRAWSASPYRFYPHYSWFVDFADLTTSHLERFKAHAVILVRDATQPASAE